MQHAYACRYRAMHVSSPQIGGPRDDSAMHRQPTGVETGQHIHSGLRDGQVITHFGSALRLNGDLRVARLIELTPPSNIRMRRLTRPMAAPSSQSSDCRDTHVGSVVSTHAAAPAAARSCWVCGEAQPPTASNIHELLGHAQPLADDTANETSVTLSTEMRG